MNLFSPTMNQTFLEVVAPEKQRATLVHTKFKQANFPILELVEILLVAPYVVSMYCLIGIVTARVQLLSHLRPS